MPRWPNKTIETEEQSLAQSRPLDVPVDGSLDGLIRVDQEIVVADSPALDDYAAQLAFMEEYVEITVHESTDANAEPIVDVYCNGMPQRFIRGVQQKVKRKYVEVLANARQTSIKTNVRNDGDNVYNRIDKHTALRYPFSMNDSNPKGRAWLQSVLATG
jgi:hypothetical protein